MKRLLYYSIFLFLMALGESHGQSINGIALKDIEANYIMIMGVGSPLNNNVKVQVDFGQRVDALIFRDKEMAIKDEKGEKVFFNSMIDALNFFEKNGYDFVNAYVITETTGFGKPQNVLNWLLRKR